MNKKDAGPAFLKAEDLIRDGKWHEYTLTVSEVLPANTVKAADGTPIDGPIVCFANAKKRFICKSECNRKLVIHATGEADPMKWAGHKITLCGCSGNWFGVEGGTALRVALPPKGKPRPQIKKKDYGECLTGQAVGMPAEVAPNATPNPITIPEIDHNPEPGPDEQIF